MRKYYGYSYPKFLQNKFCQFIWQHTFCKCGWHLWDEVLSDEHYLYCDACEKVLKVKDE